MNNTLNKTWQDFYASRVNESYFNYIKKRYKVFIDLIKMSARPSDLLTELGCGICSISKALDEQLEDIYLSAYDNNFEMLKLAKKNIVGTNKIVLGYHNALSYKLSMGDILHSHGLLEHFEDNEIRRIINLNKKSFREQFHYVPSAKYNIPSFGDERLMTPEQWHKICQPKEIIEFNEGYDLILIF